VDHCDDAQAFPLARHGLKWYVPIVALATHLPPHVMIISFYNIRWKLPAELFFDDIKWLFLIETQTSLLLFFMV